VPVRSSWCIGVGEGGLKLDGARALVHLVVDKVDGAAVERRAAVGGIGLNRNSGLAQREAALGHGRGRQCKDDRDGLHLAHHHDGVGFSGTDIVAGVDEPHAGAAGDGRGDGGVAELRAGEGDLRLVDFHLSAVLSHEGALLINLLLAGEALDHEILIALEVERCAFKQGLILEKDCLLLVHLGLDQACVDHGQRLACRHVLTFAEQHGGDLAVDPRSDRDGVQRLDSADPAQDDGDVLGASLGGLDLHGMNRFRQTLRTARWGSEVRRDDEPHPDKRERAQRTYQERFVRLSTPELELHPFDIAAEFGQCGSGKNAGIHESQKLLSGESSHRWQARENYPGSFGFQPSMRHRSSRYNLTDETIAMGMGTKECLSVP